MENNTKDRELLLTCLLNAPVDRVWEVWTQLGHIAQWWGPNGFSNTITIMDMKAGGRWSLIMHGPDGTNYKNESIFKEVVHHKKIVFDHFSPKFTATVQFEAQGEQTQLTWRMLFDSAKQFNQAVKTFRADEGQKQNIDKLNAYLAKIRNKAES